MEDKDFDKDKFDLEKILKEPEFKIDPQKYIDRYKNLISEIDQYIGNTKQKIKASDGIMAFGYRSELIFAEFQRETIQQMINCLNFYSK